MRLPADILGMTDCAKSCFAALFLAAAAPLCAQMTDILPAAPVDHFRLYGFDKVNGWRAWQLEGARANIGTDGSIQVTDMMLRVFEANERQVVNLTIESPLARMPVSRDRIEGRDSILLTAKGVSLGGVDWVWQPEGKRLLIKHKTHVVIEGEIGPVLE